MKKGISPVVAVVLLIAIAVIAAVGVWYWVGAYTGKPAVGVEQRAMSITECRTDSTTNITKVLVRNVGGMTLNSPAAVYNAAGTEIGYLDISDMASGDVEHVYLLNATGDTNISVTPGVFRVIDSAYPEYTFTCTA